GQGPAAREVTETHPRQEAHLLQLHAADEHTGGELAGLFSVGRSTVYRALQRAERGRENALQ
ncbi:MAG: hypothetical protein E6Z70_06455, partial [Cutibacterium avidum]|nr:hypothetical protein [Cutibacterium avidum]